MTRRSKRKAIRKVSVGERGSICQGEPDTDPKSTLKSDTLPKSDSKGSVCQEEQETSPKSDSGLKSTIKSDISPKSALKSDSSNPKSAHKSDTAPKSDISMKIDTAPKSDISIKIDTAPKSDTGLKSSLKSDVGSICLGKPPPVPALRPVTLAVEVGGTSGEGAEGATPTPVLDTPTITNLVLNSLEGVHSGVPTRTTPTLTPTTLRNIEQTFLELSSVPQPECHTNQAGFVPPLVHPNTGNTYISVDNKCWGGGTTHIATSNSPPMVVHTGTVPTPGHPLQHTMPPHTQRRPGGRRPIKDERISAEEEERRSLRRERNKLAAARCRKRRMDQTNMLQDETDDLEDKKCSLQNEIQILQQQRDELEFLLATHKAVCTRRVTQVSQHSAMTLHHNNKTTNLGNSVGAVGTRDGGLTTIGGREGALTTVGGREGALTTVGGRDSIVTTVGTRDGAPIGSLTTVGGREGPVGPLTTVIDPVTSIGGIGIPVTTVGAIGHLAHKNVGAKPIDKDMPYTLPKTVVKVTVVKEEPMDVGETIGETIGEGIGTSVGPSVGSSVGTFGSVGTSGSVAISVGDSIGRPRRPTTLNVRAPTVAELGVSIETPSSGLRGLNFESMMEGGTGLTPVSSGLTGLTGLTPVHSGLTPLSTPVVSAPNTSNCRSSSSSDLSSPESVVPPKLVSL